MQTILVVDDEAPIVDAISYNLVKEGFSVDSAADADECLSRIALNRPDLIVLDVMLPSGSGLDICKRLRAEEVNIPVILLTARAAESDTLRGFEVGADDYVTKPFRMRELMARIHALLRRSVEIEPDADAMADKAEEGRVEILKLSVDGHILTIDSERREMSRDSIPIALSRKEFDLLTLLATNRGKVFDRQTLLSRVWGEDCYVDDRTVDVHIRWLREKLERIPARPEMLLTIRGIGYKFQG